MQSFKLTRCWYSYHICETRLLFNQVWETWFSAESSSGICIARHFSTEQWEGCKQLMLPHSHSCLFSCPVKEEEQSWAPVRERFGNRWVRDLSWVVWLPVEWEKKENFLLYHHCELWVLWRRAVEFWPLEKSEQLERGQLEMRRRSWFRPKAPWNDNWSLSYILSGFVVLGSMILCWVSYQNCGNAIAYSKPCWQAGITQALHLCRWEQIQWVWPETLVEFKLVVSYFSLTR